MNPDSRDRPADYTGGDVRIRTIVYVMIGLGLMTAFVLAGNRLLFDLFEAREARRAAAPSPFDDVPREVPDPALQVDPSADLERLETQMDERLGSYDWVDAERGLVRIPIERAIELSAEEGLPVLGELPGGPTP